MAVQQSKKSKASIRSRKSANAYKGLQTSPCPHCGAQRIPHRVCNGCGYYKGRQVLSVTVQ